MHSYLHSVISKLASPLKFWDHISRHGTLNGGKSNLGTLGLPLPWDPTRWGGREGEMELCVSSVTMSQSLECISVSKVSELEGSQSPKIPKVF